MQGLCDRLTGGSSPFSLSIYISSVMVCKASVLNWPGGFICLIYMQCSSMQGLCAQLTRGFISFLYIYLSVV